MPAKLRESDCTKRQIVPEELHWVAISLIIYFIMMTACVTLNRNVKFKKKFPQHKLVSLIFNEKINQDQF